MQLNKKEIRKFQKEILEWYEKNKRDLPWRHSRDPYTILVSEVMLQQTQVARVIPKFQAWIEAFPTVASLAKASTRDVLQYWSGLGYNRRALYLQRLAKEVVKNNSGVFPQDEKELKKLPGIGEYTARAILCFAFNRQVAVVDTNIRKAILTRIMNNAVRSRQKSKHNIYGILHTASSKPASPAEIGEIAHALLPIGHAYEWNQALMDYASSELKKERIPIAKQTKFKTSNRFYRGQIIHMLLKESGAIDIVFEKLENNGISKEKFKEIVFQMEKEGLLVVSGNEISLP